MRNAASSTSVDDVDQIIGPSRLVR
jgi:hypothetical protein